MHTIIGVDCATQPEKTGMALAHLDGADLSVDEPELGSKRCEPKDTIKDTITKWIRKRLESHQRVLIALDAPLGWPASLGRSLVKHRAGDAIALCSDQLFRRRTDDEIKKRLGKRPLEVGADRIARTARAALKLLDELRQELGLEIPLAWNPEEPGQVAAIEVYPAATLLARDSSDPGHAWEVIQQELGLADAQPRNPSPHKRDAVLCALAGTDFLRGLSVAPTPDDLETAKKEGWIWARRSEPDYQV